MSQRWAGAVRLPRPPCRRTWAPSTPSTHIHTRTQRTHTASSVTCCVGTQPPCLDRGWDKQGRPNVCFAVGAYCRQKPGVHTSNEIQSVARDMHVHAHTRPHTHARTPARQQHAHSTRTAHAQHTHSTRTGFGLLWWKMHANWLENIFCRRPSTTQKISFAFPFHMSLGCCSLFVCW